MKNTKIIVFAGIIFSLLTGCLKSPEEKMMGSWAIKEVLVNGEDKTFVLDTLKFLFYDFRGNSTKNVSFGTDGCPKPKWLYACDKTGQTGKYEINNLKKTFSFNSSVCSARKSAIPMFIAENETWKIEKWTLGDLWLSMETVTFLKETNKIAPVRYEVKLYNLLRKSKK